MIGRGGCTVILALAAMASSTVATAAGDDALADRLALLAAAERHELRFEEERLSGLFSEPVTYTGRLQYDAETGHFTKWVEAPEPARMTVTPSRLELESADGHTRSVALITRPELAAFLDGFRALIAGDAAALESAFDSEYAEDETGAWRLRLTPLHRRIAHDVSALVVTGQDAQLQRIVTERADGDRHDLRIVSERRDG